MKFRRAKIISIVIFAMFLIFSLLGCGATGSAGDGDGGGGGDTPTEVAFLSVALSQSSVKSDNSDEAEITAMVLDADRVPVEGAGVTFSTSGGQISGTYRVTDINGMASITFSSGGVDKSNQTVTLQVSVSGLERQVPIQITGTTLTVDAGGTTTLEIGGNDTSVLTIIAKDAGNSSISDAVININLDSASTGNATITPLTGETDINGELEVEITGTSAGEVIIRADGLGTTVTQNYSVGSTGNVFGISSPSEDPVSLNTDDSQEIIVTAPGVDQVRFATSVGFFGPAPGEQYVDVDVAADGTASATFSSGTAGVATIQVFDVDDIDVFDTLTVAVSAPEDEAAQIALQATPSIVAPSSGSVHNIVDLVATVKTDGDQPVGGATVAFSILNPTGGGESIYPVLVNTDAYGKARSVFTSGSQSSGAEGVEVAARVLGAVFDPDSVDIIIGGTPGSVVIGQSTEIQSNDTGTYYILPMSVLVTDAAGQLVSGVDVSISSWPLEYNTGYWDPDDKPVITGTYPNEDINRNTILDAGEDVGTNPGHGDGIITPLNAASGSVPSIVTTDDVGVANFELVYLKQYAVWINAEITASTLVSGTETKSNLIFTLPYKEDDAGHLPDSSPFGR